MAPAKPVDGLELNELCTFVGRIAQKVWLWLALCRRTLQVVAYALGCRGRRTARRLWRRLPPDYRRAWCYTDLWETYRSVIPWRQHLAGYGRGPTNHVEPLNATLRARIGRLVRKSLFFSRSLKMLDASIQLFLHNYNNARKPT